MPFGNAGTVFPYVDWPSDRQRRYLVGLLITNGMTNKVFMILAVFSVIDLATLFVPRKPDGKP